MKILIIYIYIYIIVKAAFVEAGKEGFNPYDRFQCRNDKSIATCRFGCAKK